MEKWEHDSKGFGFLDDRANGLKETKEKNGSDKMQNEITEEIKKIQSWRIKKSLKELQFI